eukprot:CAMPEP_0197867440 /NCGR_PEP_ID=MMETSP1438-20131217/44759_1 /TAXON_ID=1461541 /ORGANISM="Pterosperma sp., Strain CCMP1384" /LENGTH=51 /DNA_ID=CAMNT_0043486091 /DNA_START=866 /DNA_END=1017 /DNA_ORIENTATION=+
MPGALPVAAGATSLANIPRALGSECSAEMRITTSRVSSADCEALGPKVCSA